MHFGILSILRWEILHVYILWMLRNARKCLQWAYISVFCVRNLTCALFSLYIFNTLLFGNAFDGTSKQKGGEINFTSFFSHFGACSFHVDSYCLYLLELCVNYKLNNRSKKSLSEEKKINVCIKRTPKSRVSRLNWWSSEKK